jgi:hypothetical protein
MQVGVASTGGKVEHMLSDRSDTIASATPAATECNPTCFQVKPGAVYLLAHCSRQRHNHTCSLISVSSNPPYHMSTAAYVIVLTVEPATIRSENKLRVAGPRLKHMNGQASGPVRSRHLLNFQFLELICSCWFFDISEEMSISSILHSNTPKT